MGTIATLPLWKKDASAADRLEELACMAREYPERFEAFVLVWRGTQPSGNWKIRTHAYHAKQPGNDLMLDQVLGLLELGKFEFHEDSKK